MTWLAFTTYCSVITIVLEAALILVGWSLAQYVPEETER